MIVLNIVKIALALLHIRVYLGVVQAQPGVPLIDSQDNIHAILDAHNKYGAIHGSPELDWSSNLDENAAAWVEECRWEDDGWNRNQGENLYA